MSRGAKIVNVDPAFAIAGGEIVIDCAGFDTSDVSRCSVLIGDASAQIVALGPRRVLAVVPETTPGQVEVRLSSGDQLSARNRFTGTVTDVKVEGLLAQVEILVTEPVRLVAIVTRDAVDALGLKPGHTATGVVKSTSVMVQH